MDILYAIPAANAPHGEIYTCCEPHELDNRRILAMLNNPQLFVREPVAHHSKCPMVCRQPVLAEFGPEDFSCDEEWQWWLRKGTRSKGRFQLRPVDNAA